MNGLSFEYPTVVKICGSNVRKIIKQRVVEFSFKYPALVSVLNTMYSSYVYI